MFPSSSFIELLLLGTKESYHMRRWQQNLMVFVIGFSHILSVLMQSSLLFKHVVFPTAAYFYWWTVYYFFSNNSYEHHVVKFREKCTDDLTVQQSQDFSFVSVNLDEGQEKRTRMFAILAVAKLDVVQEMQY